MFSSLLPLRNAGNVCWTHEVDGATVTFNATCKPAFFVQPAWCAFGLSLSGSSKMAPAEVFWISALSDGNVSVEDRFNARGHAAPACTLAQASTQLSGSVLSDGTIMASWSRPLAVNTSVPGLMTIVPGQSVRVIAAWAEKKDQQAAPCLMGWGEHKTHYAGSTTF